MRYLAFIVVIVAILPLALASVPRTDYQSYTTMTPVAFNCNSFVAGLNVHVGGVCFVLDGTESGVAFHIHDQLTTSPWGMAYFYDPASGSLQPLPGGPLNYNPFCGDSGIISIPPHASGSVVWVQLGAYGTIQPLQSNLLPGSGCHEYATIGTVQANFS